MLGLKWSKLGLDRIKSALGDVRRGCGGLRGKCVVTPIRLFSRELPKLAKIPSDEHSIEQ